MIKAIAGELLFLGVFSREMEIRPTTRMLDSTISSVESFFLFAEEYNTYSRKIRSIHFSGE